MGERIFVFAFNKGTNDPDACYRGYFDGQQFIPRKIGYCDSLEELYEYDYVQLFGDNGAQKHIPKTYNRDLFEEMKDSYLKVFGKEQIALF